MFEREIVMDLSLLNNVSQHSRNPVLEIPRDSNGYDQSGLMEKDGVPWLRQKSSVS